ncbi:hypothetical protein BFW88_21185 [Pseudomonas fluorescens]|nr:hypothetical protein BFW88_21185 [Pseudomonas fluorescens]OPB05946.1 hypothetical protein BFW92_21135 [Pseudomonas fluorescens]OPB17386.1 hypothetical protein BFW93_21165 [Pseudomonas fluorescens]
MHVNGRGGFCHVVRGLFECRAILGPLTPTSPRKPGHQWQVVQNALPPNAIIATCNESPLQTVPNQLILLS